MNIFWIFYALSIDAGPKAAYVNVLCVQTDTKLISGPVETRLAFGLSSKNFMEEEKPIFF